MMSIIKNLLLGLSSIFIFTACGNDCLEERIEFVWSRDKSIEINPEIETVMIGDSTISIIEYQIKDGQDILFEFNEFFDACDDDIADGNGSRKFFMVIPSDSISSFSYTDQEILETFAFFRIFSAPEQLPDQFIEEGEIIGTKIDDDSWRISIDVITQTQEYSELNGDLPQVISIENIFSPK